MRVNPRISADPGICGGEPCIAGTRIPVHVILSHLAAGDPIETLRAEFPRVEKADIIADELGQTNSKQEPLEKTAPKAVFA